jgi:ABC-type molybdate transport system substrate-binding protein
MFQITFRKICLLALALLSCASAMAQSDKPELLLYCGITMVRPMTEIVQLFEKRENVKILVAQGSSEDSYQSAKKSAKGDWYLPGEPSYREKHIKEGLLGDFVNLGYNQLALVVQKGNPKQVKADLTINWRATGLFADYAQKLDVIDMDSKLAKPQALLLSVLKSSKYPELAHRFMQFASGLEGQAIFRKHGFLDNKTHVSH